MKLKNNSSKRGTRGHATGPKAFANTKHLYRIITFLNEQDAPLCKTKIGIACCTDLSRVNDALAFMVACNLVDVDNLDSTRLYQLNGVFREKLRRTAAR